MKDLPKECPSLQSRIALHVLAFFRYNVLCSSAITCYCLCYLAYEHNYHYCLHHPYACTEEQKQNSKVPWPIILFILACVASTIESLSSTFHFLHKNQHTTQPRLGYAQLLVTTTPVTILFLISYWSFYRLPSVKLPCPFGPNNYRNLRESPETYDCCITVGVIIAGGIAVFFQLLITIIAAMVLAIAQLKHRSVTLAEGSSSVSAVVATKKSDGRQEEVLAEV